MPMATPLAYLVPSAPAARPMPSALPYDNTPAHASASAPHPMPPACSRLYLPDVYINNCAQLS